MPEVEKNSGVKLKIKLSFIQSTKMMGKVLVTHQTGPKVKRLKDYTSKRLQTLKRILFIMFNRSETSKCLYSSTEGGMDIEKVALETPEKIITNMIDLKKVA